MPNSRFQTLVHKPMGDITVGTLALDSRYLRAYSFYGKLR